MTDPSFDAADACRALTLQERAALARSCGTPDPSTGWDGARARRLLDRWKGQPPFADSDWFSQRLRSDGLTEPSLLRLLGEPAAWLRDLLPEPPSWMRRLADAYGPESFTAAAPLDLDGSWIDEPSTGFLELIRPLISRARERLRSGLQEAVGAGRRLPFDPAGVERLLAADLPARLLPLLDRTLVLELNVARVEERLEGATPEDRFRSFIGLLRGREAASAILREYPVLARLAASRLDSWVEASLELLARLGSDWSALEDAFFGGADPGLLTRLDGGAGDLHRGGRSVTILSFASGAKLVYKPRPVAVDLHFQELLGWLNERGGHPAFRTLAVLDRGGHGWIEHVAAEGCSSEEEVRRYHRRLGGLLAILHVVEATDFHYENLIASRDHPVAIDLESLLHPRAPRPVPRRPDERLAGLLLANSVLRVGLLPFRVGETEEFEGVDLSGVASVAGQPAPQRVLQWEGAGTDEMHAVRSRPAMEAGRNRPVLGGREADAADYVADVAAGFEELYRLLLRRREELLAPGGPVSHFSGDAVRAVLRSTRAYGLLAEEASHPDFLRDALDRDLFLDRLWVGLEAHPALARAVPHERLDLWEGDIPYFWSRTDAADLWTSRGDRIAGFFEEPALESVRRRVRGLSEEDLRRQSWLLRLSLSTRLLNRDDADWPGYASVNPDPRAGDEDLRDSLLAAAREVGGWFDRMAVRDGEDVTWIGLDFRNRRWSLTPMSEDLYAGIPGIALFLGYLGGITGEEASTRLARSAAGTLLRRLDHDADAIRFIGAFQGWGGILYVLAHLGSLWRDGRLLAEGEEIVERIAALVEQDEDLDVVGGAAGAIGALLAQHRAAGSPRALQAALLCGERLLRAARPAGNGLAWCTRVGGDEPQTGFSHGGAGIAMALADLAAAGGEERLREAALAGFAFERALFWPELDRWLGEGARPLAQMQDPPLERMVATAWCYGAPGVGLSRLRALRHAEDAALREELERAVEVTLRRGFGQNHCLCHGDLGNLDFLEQACGGRGSAGLRSEVRRLAQVVLGSIERDGWLCGTHARVESPGLMNGLAGIGYGLLRLAHPDRVGSVLTLDPPSRPA